MAFQVSPGINVSEIDLTTVVPAVSTTIGAFAGVFNWGPAEERVLVSSENSLIKLFGKPTTSNYETFYTAANFLSYGNALYIARAVDTVAKNAQANTGAADTILIKNLADYESNNFDPEADVVYYARYAGALGNSLKISVCDTAEAYSSAVDLVFDSTDEITWDDDGTPTLVTDATGTVTLTPNDNIGVIEVTTDEGQDAAIACVQRILDGIAIGDQLLVEGTNQYMKVVAKGTAEAEGLESASATLSFEKKYTGISTVTADETTTLTRFWEFYNVVSRAPGQSAFVELYGNTAAQDELHVVVVDELGQFTGTKNAVLEVFEGISRATDSKGQNGKTLYYKDIIANDSEYIYLANERSGAGSATAAEVASSTNVLPLTLSMNGGVDSESEGDISVGAIAAAYDLYKDPDVVDISLLLTGRADSTVANYVIDNIAESRKDCVAFVSPTRTTSADQIVSFRNSLSSTSYAVLDSGYKYQYDRYNDVYRYIPLNGDIAGLCARTDVVRDPWFSPAGFNRGQIKNVVKLNFNPTQAERDLLYKNAINPVVTFPGQGTVLFGDKTLLARPSAFDRINVRRLFIVLEKAISTAAKSSLFEFNDEFTRAQFRNLVEPYLREIQGRQGVTDFKVICDRTNNTADVIDRNEFVGDIYIKPARSINFIQLNFVAVRSGVEFNEIVQGV